MTERWGRDRSPRRPMSAARAAALLELLARRGLDAWLEGGWAIDALLGRQTRSHDDLDLVVPLEQVGELEAVLAERGLERLHGAPPTSFYLVDPRGHQVDVHPVSFTKAGEAVYEMENGREWVYPAGAFRGRGRIAGRPVGCLAPEQLLVTHSTGYELDAVHRRDVERLCRRFGFPVPHFGTA